MGLKYFTQFPESNNLLDSFEIMAKLVIIYIIDAHCFISHIKMYKSMDTQEEEFL
jgi:hypothetical protein